jgi:ATP-dependent RNA helicase DDX10/DBP4
MIMVKKMVAIPWVAYLTTLLLWQVLEKLYRVKWTKMDGVGCIIITPTNDLAGQIWDVVNRLGTPLGFSGGAIVKRNGIDDEKEAINRLNIIVCTPGRLVQHFDETPNFDCSQLQVTRHNLIYGFQTDSKL